MKQLTVILLMFCISACSTTRSYNDLGPGSVTDLKPGDRVTMELADGRAGDYRILSLDEEGLAATDATGNAADYRYSEIERVDVSRVSGRKTAVGALITGVVVIAVVGAALSDAAFLPAGP